MRRLSLLVLLTAAISMAGCPDYSHLRPVPDYENMTDGGASTETMPEE